MKIAILVSSFPPKWLGGIEIVTQNIARYLAINGNEVHVITSLDKGFEKESQENNFFIYRTSYPKIKILGTIIFWIKCFFLIKKINPEIVHSQSIQMGLSALLARKFLGIPYVVYCHGSDVYLPWKFKKIISAMIFNEAGAVIALTDDMKNELKKNCKKDIIVIPNGIDPEKFEGFPKQIIRDKFKIQFKEKIIVFVGGLRPVKGVKYLIEAFSIINQKNSDVKLFLVGDGLERRKLEDAVKKADLEKKVNFIGQVENNEIPKYMSISDIFVLPSLSEGLPVVILEAMACGLPIVATKAGGMPEVVKDGENGFLVEPKKPEQIAEKVLLLLRDDELREKISNNNREKAKKYSWINAVDKIEKIYSEVIVKKHGK